MNTHNQYTAPKHLVETETGAVEVMHFITTATSLVFSKDFKHLHFDQPGKIVTMEVANQQIVQEYEVAGYPSVAGCSPDGRYVYAWDWFYPRTLIIDTQNQTITEGYVPEHRPIDMAVSADGSQLFLCSMDPSNQVGDLLVIDSKEQTLSKKIQVGKIPAKIIQGTINSRVYVSCWGVFGADNGVYAIEIGTSAVTRIPTGEVPWGMTISPDGESLYVCNFDSNTLTVIDTLNDGVKGTINVSKEPRALSFTRNGKYLYVIYTLTTIIPWSGINVIDPISREVVRTIEEKKDLREVVMGPNGNDLWLARYV